MHVRNTKRLPLVGGLALCLVGGGSTALAQGNVDPEMMLVIDASARMQWRIDGTEPVGCEPTNNRPISITAPPNIDLDAAAANRTRMSILKQALAGVGSSPDLCLVEDHVWRFQHHEYGADRITQHYRDLCCANPNNVDGSCPAGAVYEACYNDHGLADNDADRAAQEVADLPNSYHPLARGFLESERFNMRFGLMVSDASPFGDAAQIGVGPIGDARDPTSFGNDPYVVGIAGNNVDPRRRYGIAASPGGQPTFMRFDTTGAVSHPNLGVRDETASSGFLVPTYKGTYNQFLNPPLDRNAPVVSGPAEHNDLVRLAVRRLVAVGNTPLSAMMYDMRVYYGGVDANDDPDTSCRPKAAVIFTDGTETPYYGGEYCVLPANQDLQAAAPGCDGGKGTCAWRPLLDLNGAQRACDATCIAANGEVCRPTDGVDPANGTACMRPACSYAEGYPYPSAASTAADLFSKGIEVYVVALWPDAYGRSRAMSLAAAGSPGRGNNGADGYFEVDAQNTTAAVNQINAALKIISLRLGATRTTDSKPLVITPSAADENGQARTVRQWRIFGYTESPRGDFRDYGRVDALAYGCPANAQSSVEVLPANSSLFHESLRTRDEADPRRGVAVKPAQNPRLASGPDTGNVLAVVGMAGSMFGDSSAQFLPDDTSPLWLAVKGLAAIAVDDSYESAATTRLFQGFLGKVGQPNAGPYQAQVGQRSFGGVGRSELVALGPPALGLPDEGYTNFAAAKKNRPTLVAAGANDGQVHVFRAADGYEVFTFVPRRAWRDLNPSSYRYGSAEGPMEFGDMIGCRSLTAGGPAECAASPTVAGFRTLLVGGVGRPQNGGYGDNIYGIDLSKVRINSESAVPVNVDASDFETVGRGRIWDVTGDEVPKLGDTVSRPTLTHARIKNVAGLDPADAVRAVVIVGCGDVPSGYVPAANVVANPSEQVGRCILIINATDGRVIRQIDDAAMDAPMVGSPAVYPGVGITPAERAYIGDAKGRIWRLDMRDPSPDQWAVSIAWPPVGLPNAPVGHPSLDRPALATREDGSLVVVYGQGRGGADAARRNVVSFTDTLVPSGQPNQAPSFQAVENWTMPLRSTELVTGAPVIYDRTAFFTTVSRPVAAGACVPVVSRLYGVHYYDVLRDANGNTVVYSRPDDDPAEPDAPISVKPMLPRVADDGTATEPALSLALPPGRQVSGLALASTPSCVDGEAPTTDIILNVADQSAGAAPAGVVRQKIEFVENGALTAAPFDNSIYVDGDGVGLRVCLNCDRDGTSRGQGGVRITPFPSEVIYWGTTFTN